MGYYENLCRLCGVSFNIGRVRHPDEPRYMGWINTGDGIGLPYKGDNCIEGECWLVDRNDECSKDFHAATYFLTKEIDESFDDEEDDADFTMTEIQSETEYDGELMSESGNEEDGAFIISDQHLLNSIHDQGCDLRERSLENLEPRTVVYSKGESAASSDTYDTHNQYSNDQERLLPLDYLDRLKVDQAYYKMIEHVSTSSMCDLVSFAYNGNTIEYEEMKDCIVFQAVGIRKVEGSEEEDDLDYESKSHYVFTGLSSHMPSTDIDSPRYRPIRHGLDEEVSLGDFSQSIDDIVLPFHPWCFDIFNRISRKRLGTVDLEGLIDCYIFLDRQQPNTKHGGTDDRLRGYYDGQHTDVIECQNQWWLHIQGLEYLVASPLFIPKLGHILDSVIVTDSNFHPAQNAFPDHPTTITVCDGFSTLPLELNMQIVSYLDSKDIANLRLSTRSFWALPIVLWKDLLMKEMPWLWEVWCDDAPFYWTMVSSMQIDQSYADFEKQLEDYEIRAAECARLCAIIEEEYSEESPIFVQEWRQAANETLGIRPVLSQDWRSSTRQIRSKLPSDKSNWYLLYTLIKRYWDNLKGLKNRRRIWHYVEKLIDVMDYKREEGI